MKKIKSISTLLVALMLIVSMLGTSVFAAPTLFDGNNVAGGTDMEIVAGTKGKDSADKVYKISVASADQKGIRVANNHGNHLTTIEFSFMIPSGSSGFSVNGYYYKNTTAGSTTDCHSFARNLISIKAGSKIGSSAVIERDRWYTFALLLPNDGSKKAQAYLNGADIGQITLSVGVYGVRRGFLGGIESTDVVYIDNQRDYKDISRGYTGTNTNSAEFDAERIKSSSVSVKDGVENYAISNNVISVPEHATIADVKNAIETTDEIAGTDEIRVYTDSSMEVLNVDDTALADGKVLVVAAENGTDIEMAYSYYNIKAVDPDDELGRGKNPSELKLALSDDSVPYTMTTTEGIYGKSYFDDSYTIDPTGSKKVDGILLSNTFVGTSTFDGTWGKLEFQFALEPDAVVTAHMAFYPHSSSITSYERFNFLEGGVSFGSSITPISRKADIVAGEWNTVTITIPTSENNNDGKVKVYLNGSLLYEKDGSRGDGEEIKGLRRPFIIVQNGVAHLDNIYMEQGNSYDTAKHTPSWLDIDNALTKGDKISYTVMPEASDFHPGASTNVRFYDEEWNEVENTAKAQYVVTGEKDADGYETSIKYYTFDSSAKDYIAGGYYDKDNNFYVKAYGKNAGDSLYYATYETASKDELDQVVAGAMNTADNKAEISGTFGDKPYRFFFWDKDINPLVKSIALELRK